MPRRQKPLNGDDPVVRFAARLRRARCDAGLTLRELAAASGYSHSTLSVAEGGERLPSWEVTEAFVQACRQPDISRWRGWWDAAAEARPTVGPERAPTVPAPVAAVQLESWPVVATPRPGRQGLVHWRYLPITALLTVILTILVAVPLLRGHLLENPPYPSGSDPLPAYNCGEGAPGYGCHGKDQNVTGCYAGAEVVARSDGWGVDGVIPQARLETWYSDTCGTSWATMSVKSNWEMRLEISAGEARRCHPADCTSFSAVSSPAWTPMVFAVNQPTRVRGAVRTPVGEVILMEAEAP